MSSYFKFARVMIAVFATEKWDAAEEIGEAIKFAHIFQRTAVHLQKRKQFVDILTRYTRTIITN